MENNLEINQFVIVIVFSYIVSYIYHIITHNCFAHLSVETVYNKKKTYRVLAMFELKIR